MWGAGESREKVYVSTDTYVTYSMTDKTGAVHNRRTGPFGEEAATAFAREIARRESISAVVVEIWSCTERRAVTA